jgi:hypothetical protein
MLEVIPNSGYFKKIAAQKAAISFFFEREMRFELTTLSLGS